MVEIAIDIALRGARLAAWTPAALGPSLWLAADAGTYQDAARTTPATADGDPVGGWADQSGTGLHAAQTTAAARPTLQLSEVNGKPVLRFDGVNDLLTTLAAQYVGTDGTWTAFAVARTTGGSYAQQVVNHDVTTGARIAQFMRYGAATTAQSVAFNTAVAVFIDPMPAGSGFAVLGAVRGAASVETFVNGSSDGATATTGTPASGAGAGVDIGGHRVNPGEYLTGDIAEVVVVDRALSTTERQQLEAHLGAKYGLTIS